MTTATWWARLASDGTLLGFSKAKIAGAPEVPENCDLAPGRYVWNPAERRFDPRGRAVKPDQTAAALDLMMPKALALTIQALAGGRPPPEWCVIWARNWMANHATQRVDDPMPGDDRSPAAGEG